MAGESDRKETNVRQSSSPSTADADLLTIHGKKIKVTDEELVVMLEKAAGFRSRVAKQLGVSSSAITHRIQRSEFLREACRTVEDTIIDLAESKLYEAVQNREPWAITFVLKCKGRNRGWVERQDLVFGKEMDAPPPPFVLGLHDPGYVEDERKRQEAAMAATVEAMTIDVTPVASKAEKEAERPGKKKPEPAVGPEHASGPAEEPVVEVVTDTWTMVRPVEAETPPEPGPGAAQGASDGKDGVADAPAQKAPVKPQNAPMAKPQPKPAPPRRQPEPPKVPRTPSEAAAMRREREARERSTQGAQTTQGHSSAAVPVAFPRRM